MSLFNLGKKKEETKKPACAYNPLSQNIICS